MHEVDVAACADTFTPRSASEANELLRSGIEQSTFESRSTVDVKLFHSGFVPSG